MKWSYLLPITASELVEIKRSVRWWMASKFIRWAIQLTHSEMDGPLAQAGWAFIEHFRRMNTELNRP